MSSASGTCKCLIKEASEPLPGLCQVCSGPEHLESKDGQDSARNWATDENLDSTLHDLTGAQWSKPQESATTNMLAELRMTKQESCHLFCGSGSQA